MRQCLRVFSDVWTSRIVQAQHGEGRLVLRIHVIRLDGATRDARGRRVESAFGAPPDLHARIESRIKLLAAN